jgi:hypothetical protein
MRKTRTQESKIAKVLADSVDSVTLDLDEVGKILARTTPTVLCNRLDVIIESARYEKENMYERNTL